MTRLGPDGAACCAAVVVAVIVGGGVEAAFLPSGGTFDRLSPPFHVAGDSSSRLLIPPWRPRHIIKSYGHDGSYRSKFDDDGDDGSTNGLPTSQDEEGQAEVIAPQQLVRLNKALSCAHSRRSADKLIAAGRVTVNGHVITALGSKVDPVRDVIRVDGALVDAVGVNADMHGSIRDRPDESNRRVPTNDEEALLSSSPHEYVKYWKPVGITCTCDERVPGNLVEAMSKWHPSPTTISSRTTSFRRRLFPVGRLDKDTSGLLLLTSDGLLPNSVLKSTSGQPKTYRVTLDRPMHESDRVRLEKGVVITTETSRRATAGTNPTTGTSNSYRRRALTARTRPAIVQRDGPNDIVITITEGRNRQVRKMVAAVGYQVVHLHRISFLGIGLEGLDGPGDFARLGSDELTVVQQAIRLHEQGAESSTARQ